MEFGIKERREAILRFIERRGEVSIGELTASFSSRSEMTLRRDLDFLSKNHKVILTRGGARVIPPRFFFNGEDIYSERARRNLELKQEIAIQAAAMIEPGTGIFIDAGTTAMEFAHALPDCHLAVVTNAPNIALEIITQKKSPSVIMLGGTLNRNTLSITDTDFGMLETLNIDTAFLSASGFDPSAGFSVGNQADCQLKRRVMARSRRVIMMIDSSKIGTLMPFSFATLADIDICLSDSQAPAQFISMLKNNKKRVTQISEK